MSPGRVKYSKFKVAVIVFVLLYVLSVLKDHYHVQREKSLSNENGERTIKSVKVGREKLPGTEGRGKVLEEIKTEERRQKQKMVVLWTGWRYGSSFIGRLLERASNNTFYSYEPLHMFGVKVMDQEGELTSKAMKVLKDMLLCQHELHEDYIEHMTSIPFLVKQNMVLARRCGDEKKKGDINPCSSPSFVSSVCRSADLNVIKVLRMSLRFVRELLDDEDLDIQVIYMARDPRAVLNSRIPCPWCKNNCLDPQRICSLLDADLQEVPLLVKEYPKRFKYVEYDRICDNATGALHDIMSFIGLPIRHQQKILLPKREDGGISRADRWRLKTSFTNVVAPIQEYCGHSLKRLGLRVFESKEDMLNVQKPVLLQ